MEITTTKEHWENVFANKPENEVSWFQPYPKTSIEFIELFNIPLDANIIDIGGGDSHLVDLLLEKGYQNIWVLDISENALARVKKRLGEKATKVHWVVSDRAAFHFLTTDENINRYVSIAEKGIKTNGVLILGTFSETGPKKCSGLEIKQYSETSMSSRFELSFDRIKCITEEHQTPFNTIQNFLFCSFKSVRNP